MSSISKIIDQNIAKVIATHACGDDQSIEVIDHRLENYSKTNVGFLGNHKRLEVRIKKTKGKDELVKLSFFVKFIPFGSKEQMFFVKERHFFDQEAEFFNKVMPELLRVTAVGNIEPWAPKCYLANNDIIVQEDVRTSGFVMRETTIFKGEHLKSALRAMARLHAASILLEKQVGKPLNEVYPTVCIEQLFNKYSVEHWLNLIESLIKDVGTRNKRTITNVRENIQHILKYILNGGQGKNQVLCHGDSWPNNFMLDSSEPPKCLLVDYQMVHYVPRMIDVAQLIYLSTTRKIRKCEERDAIEIYWNELCETLRKCNPTVKRPSLETIRQEYNDDVKLVALLTAIIYFPTILLSKEVFQEYKDNPDVLYRKLVFRSSNDCILKLMDKDENYAKRIMEAVLEFVENCEKLKLCEM